MPKLTGVKKEATKLTLEMIQEKFGCIPTGLYVGKRHLRVHKDNIIEVLEREGLADDILN